MFQLIIVSLDMQAFVPLCDRKYCSHLSWLRRYLSCSSYMQMRSALVGLVAAEQYDCCLMSLFLVH